MQVWSLVVSFTWGVLNLWVIDDRWLETTEPDSQDWTFGQVIAVVLLLAPIATLVESYLDSKFVS